MRRLLLIALLLLCLPGMSEAQSCDGCGIGYIPPSGVAASLVDSIGFSYASNAGSIANGTTAQSFYVYTTFTNASNYERLALTTGNFPAIATQAAGTGTARALALNAASDLIYSDSLVSTNGDAGYIGAESYEWGLLMLTKAIVGSKSKTLVDDTATNFADVIMVQTAGANYGGGNIVYTIFCKDAANQATQSGSVAFACHNLAGTETCGFGTPNGVTLGDGTASIGTPTFTAAGGADRAALSVQSDCTGVTPTTFTFQYRFDMPKLNTIAHK